eukprot:CAMPEP_0180559068 /NCGR_PEP_ID=MMETSP1037_2-20121125/2092_1 /TAXON_ID=632150 /ORGANISM="Azadinium spinosum, Strain 3D9" /LENGTH=53 /DNA_ID=CAMNT_0022575501 /DNA_START=527 /DNA_END=688 /DNA_ORIENTATION=-
MAEDTRFLFKLSSFCPRSSLHNADDVVRGALLVMEASVVGVHLDLAMLGVSEV